MPVDVKICGLKTEETLRAALDAGADYVGLVFYEKSPRHVDMDTARSLARLARGGAKSVALFVDPDNDLVARVAGHVEPDLIQLHGHETPERVKKIADLTDRPVIKAIKVATTEDTEAAHGYRDTAAFILFDAKPLEDRADLLPGGNGVPFDWRALARAKRLPRFMLSGGLNPENVADAISLTGARAVDVSSGVESSPGEKDIERIKHFIAAAKAAKTKQK